MGRSRHALQGSGTRADTDLVKTRFAQFLLAELLAFGALFCGGLAMVGGAVTYTGGSRHSAGLSWALVALFALASLALGRTAAVRLRRVFARAG